MVEKIIPLSNERFYCDSCKSYAILVTTKTNYGFLC